MLIEDMSNPSKFMSLKDITNLKNTTKSQKKQDLIRVKEAHANLHQNIENPDFNNVQNMDMNNYILDFNKNIKRCIYENKTKCSLASVYMFEHHKALEHNPNFKIIEEVASKYPHHSQFKPYTNIIDGDDVSVYRRTCETIKINNIMCRNLTDFLNQSMGNNVASFQKNYSYPMCNIIIDIDKI
jgi:hypothetical protein